MTTTPEPPTLHDPAVVRMRRRAAGTSIAVNIFLLALKAVVAVVTGSLALWASAADSLLDLSASIIAYAGVSIGSRPPDDTHAYGHHKFESLSSLIQLSMLFVTVGVILTEAYDRFTSGGSVETPLAGVAVIVLSLVIDLWISRKLSRVAQETGGSEALEADALHFATDVFSNIAVIVGLIAVRFDIAAGDPIAAVIVAIFVGYTAIGLLRSTTGTLTDRAPDEATVERLRGTLAGFAAVKDFHTLRAREIGSRIFLDVCVELDPQLTFQEAHDISHEMQDALRRSVPEVADAVIHFEPAGHPEHQDHDHHAHGFDALSQDG